MGLHEAIIERRAASEWSNSWPSSTPAAVTMGIRRRGHGHPRRARRLCFSAGGRCCRRSTRCFDGPDQRPRVVARPLVVALPRSCGPVQPVTAGALRVTADAGVLPELPGRSAGGPPVPARPIHRPRSRPVGRQVRAAGGRVARVTAAGPDVTRGSALLPGRVARSGSWSRGHRGCGTPLGPGLSSSPVNGAARRGGPPPGLLWEAGPTEIGTRRRRGSLVEGRLHIDRPDHRAR